MERVLPGGRSKVTNRISLWYDCNYWRPFRQPWHYISQVIWVRYTKRCECTVHQLQVQFVKQVKFQPQEGEEDRSKISPSATFFDSPRDHIEDPKPSSLSGIKIFLLMLIGSIAVVACIVMGIMFYQKQQERGRKRFYWE